MIFIDTQEQLFESAVGIFPKCFQALQVDECRLHCKVPSLFDDNPASGVWEALSGQSSRSGGRTSHALRRRRRTRRERTAERLGIFLPPEPKDLVPLPLPDNRVTKPRQPGPCCAQNARIFFIARPCAFFLNQRYPIEKPAFRPAFEERLTMRHLEPSIPRLPLTD
jgi:hypothetical protein